MALGGCLSVAPLGVQRFEEVHFRSDFESIAVLLDEVAMMKSSKE
jgi:hypothetical protein